MRPLIERLEQAEATGEIKPGETRLYARLLHGMIIALTHGNRRTSRTKSRRRKWTRRWMCF